MKKWSRHLLAAGALAVGMSAAHADDSKTLYFYNWTEYVPPGLLEQFTKETGIKVIYSTYESNETMYAKLKTYKDGAYDLVVFDEINTTLFFKMLTVEEVMAVLDLRWGWAPDRVQAARALADRRRARGLSQAQLANRIGVSRPVVIALERDLGATVATLVRAAAVLGVRSVLRAAPSGRGGDRKSVV